MATETRFELGTSSEATDELDEERSLAPSSDITPQLDPVTDDPIMRLLKSVRFAAWIIAGLLLLIVICR